MKNQVVIPKTKTSNSADFGRVAVLLGGTSSEREVSLNSGKNVLEALQAGGINAFAVDGIAALIDVLVNKQADRVFNILHGNNGGGEDGIVQGLMEAFGVPYTGSKVLGSALSMDKIRTKQVWLEMGLSTPRYKRLKKGDDVHAAAAEMGLPLIIKPSCEGSSVGVSRIFSEGDLDAAVELAVSYPGELLMEQLIEGDELTVSILGEQALPSIRIVAEGWYDYQAKYITDSTQYVCPGLDEADELVVGKLALAAFEAVGCTGWGRVDVMRDSRSGVFYLLEVNTAPGMTSHSLVPKSAGQVGVGFNELCWRVLEGTL